MTSDALSDVLSLVKAKSVVSAGLRTGGDWSMRFPPPDGIKFNAVAEGACWLAMDGLAPVRLETGDVFLMTGQRTFVIASDLALPPIDGIAAFRTAVNGFAQYGDGGDVLLIAGRVKLDRAHGALLLDALPPLVHVRAASPEAATLRWLLDQLTGELAVDRPGASLAIDQLAQLMFVQTLRAHLAGPAEMANGWLRALGDARLAPAIQMIHGDPARPWKLGELARAAAMSRTSFALRFKTVVGVAPLAYLLGWRMRLAERALRDSDAPLSSVALSLGYTSESAFSNAFKRTTGSAPKRFRSSSRLMEQSVA
ncbi:MAG: transcriptional regulator, AraC family [Tardiphaga sp.]|nr:transcriptional regulator, AraC family [Tardiphaga sp.]